MRACGALGRIMSKADKRQDEDFISSFALQRELKCLETFVTTLDHMGKGYMPELPDTKKAAQKAIKELCAALCDFADKF